MKTFRFLLILSILALALPIFAQEEPVTITISTWAGVDESAELQELIDEINANTTEYQIVHQPIPSDYYTQVQTQFAGGTGADLYWMDQNHMALASTGVFMPLDECLADSEAGTAGDLTDYYPGILAVNQHEDQTYGLPWIAQPVVLYYNRDLFDAAGLEYPTSDWTWDDFVENAKAMTQDTDGDGETDQWGYIATDWPPPFMFIWQAGGEPISEDFTESPVDSPEFLEGLNFFLSLPWNEELAPSRETISEQGFGEMFRAGKIALFMGGATDKFDTVEGLNVGVVRVPAHPETGNHTTFAWNASTVISSATEHPEEACDALVALTEAIHTWKVMSPRISQGTVEHLIASDPRDEEVAAAIVEASQEMRALPIFGNYAEWEGVFWGELINPLLNKETDLTPEELAEEIRPELEDTLED